MNVIGRDWYIKDNGGKDELVGIASKSSDWFIAEEVTRENAELICMPPEQIASELIREIHADIKAMIPEAGQVNVEHSFTDSVVGETWEAHIYALAGDMLFMAHMRPTVDEMMKEVKRLYAAYDPAKHKAERMAKLRAELAALEATP